MTDEQSRNYTHVLLENLQGEMHSLRNEMQSGFDKDVLQDQQMEDRLLARIGEQEIRLRVVERMCWVSLGGMIIIGGLVGMYGQKIFHLLAG